MNTKIARKALDKKIAHLPALSHMQRPHKGWIQAVREAFGMTKTQLATRLGVTQPRVTALEKSEIDEGVTLASLRRAAEALDCALVYSFVPKSSFEKTLKVRAIKLAKHKLCSVNHTMLLEAQNLDQETLKTEIEELAEEIMRERPKSVWEDEND